MVLQIIERGWDKERESEKEGETQEYVIKSNLIKKYVGIFVSLWDITKGTIIIWLKFFF